MQVWLPAWGRWVHADPCENALDAPRMYERGWGKRLSYVFAFGRAGGVDVAPRYAVDWTACAARRDWVAEGWLELTLASMNATVQSTLSAEARAVAEARAAAELEELQRLRRSTAGPHSASSAVPVAEGGDLQAEQRGRQTGSVEWREARGELGK